MRAQQRPGSTYLLYHTWFNLPSVSHIPCSELHCDAESLLLVPMQPVAEVNHRLSQILCQQLLRVGILPPVGNDLLQQDHRLEKMFKLLLTSTQSRSCSNVYNGVEEVCEQFVH